MRTVSYVVTDLSPVNTAVGGARTQPLVDATWRHWLCGYTIINIRNIQLQQTI